MPSLPPIEKDVEIARERRGCTARSMRRRAGEPDPARFDYLLRLGDDALILGQRLSEWCGHAPALEVDLSLANLALDLIGQATLLLSLAGEAEGAGRDADALAFHRDVLDFRNCLLVEQPNGDFARTMARHLLYSTWQHMLYQRLAESSRHRRSPKSRPRRSRKSLTTANWRLSGPCGWATAPRKAPGAWPTGSTGAGASSRNCSRSTSILRSTDRAAESRPIRALFEAEYRATIGAVLARSQARAPPDQRPILGGRRGHHSEHLGHLLAVMQHLPRTYPDAIW